MFQSNNKSAAGMAAKATAKPKKVRRPEMKLTIKGYAGVTIRRVDGTVERIEPQPNVITQAGYEWIADSLYDATEPAGQARYLGLAKDNISTYLTGRNFTVTDITSPAGLSRKQSANSPYTVGTKSMALDATFTNGSSGDAQVTGIRTLTLYSAASGGVLVHAVNTSSFNLNGGDSVEVDWTITLSEPL